MSSYAIQPLGGWRNEACAIPITVPNLDLTGVPVRAQVRAESDNPVLAQDIPATTDAAVTGIRTLATTRDADGVPTSHLMLQITKAAMQALPFAGELGDAWVGVYALQIGGVTRLTGPFAALASPIDSDSAPVNRPVGWGGSAGGSLPGGVVLTIGDAGVTVVIEGTDQLALQVTQTLAARDAAEASAAVAAASDALLLDSSDVGTSAPSTYPINTAVMIACTVPFATKGIAPQVRMKFTGVGTCAVVIMQPVAGTLNFAAIGVTLLNVVAGEQTYPIIPTIAAAGSLVCYRWLSGAILAYDPVGSYLSFNGMASPPAIGDPAQLQVGVNATPAIAYTFVSAGERLPSTTSLVGPSPMVETSFPGPLAPVGWTAGPNVTLANGFSASGNQISDAVNNWMTFGQPSAAQSRRIEARLRLVDASAGFFVGVRPDAGADGAMVYVDAASGALSLYTVAYDATLAQVATTALTAAMVVQREYTLVVTYAALTTTAVLTDSLTQTVTTVTYTFVDVAKRLTWHGQPFIASAKGNIIRHVRFAVPGGKRKRAVIIADSNGEGTGLSAGTAPSWASLLTQGRTDILISARAGATSTGMVQYATADIQAHQPDHVIIATGTNDGDLGSSRTGVAALIAAAQLAGARVTLCTIPPLPGSAALQANINADRLGGYFGDLPVIDLAAAVSTNNDRVTWGPGMQGGDNVHISTAGQLKAHDQALIDAPWLQP